ncbi:deoxyhypusine synthase-like [Oopsacas minuta]|uniref:deoxyhypusine synthase n=1 Tax=Oopsacas minuta TaxID=111878 RepID=A0AAV7JVA6_9METZ|nr:deoxyhypusine synthase-like [Oopsacas minuta]
MTDYVDKARNAVLATSKVLSKNTEEVSGYNFTPGPVDYSALLASYKTTGFQATNFSLVVDRINEMLACKATPLSEEALEKINTSSDNRPISNCTIFLGYTSNMISCGLREIFCFLAKHNMVDCIVTSAGGIEEDLMKCLAPHYMGDFRLPGKELRLQGINRIGNLLVPNDNYCKFEDWIMPVYDQLLKEQIDDGINWTPSKVIKRLGREINDPSSVYYWCDKNNIPVFCPSLTDGSLGDMLFFHAFKSPGLRIDIIEDIVRINKIALDCVNSGMIILGGGMIKHHICNANLFRNGADYSVFINTAQEFDGCDAGAAPEEAISWGKIRMDSTPVKLYSDATLVFPLIVAETFCKNFKQPEIPNTEQTS